MTSQNIDNGIELRSEKARRVIGQIPSTTITVITFILFAVFLSLLFGAYSIKVPEFQNFYVGVQQTERGKYIGTLLVPQKSSQLFFVKNSKLYIKPVGNLFSEDSGCLKGKVSGAYRVSLNGVQYCKYLIELPENLKITENKNIKFYIGLTGIVQVKVKENRLLIKILEHIF